MAGPTVVDLVRLLLMVATCGASLIGTNAVTRRSIRGSEVSGPGARWATATAVLAALSTAGAVIAGDIGSTLGFALVTVIAAGIGLRMHQRSPMKAE